MMSFKNKISGLVCSTVAAGLMAVGSLTSCSDMLETESARQGFDPSLKEKTDSIYYALGILQGLQELADMYVFQGEMRGDLVDTTHYTDNNLRKLANFTATTENKYDSAYVFYKIINNCNYYIAHRDTSLRTGSVPVARSEYAAVKAIRAWTYMQLARTYGEVPFYTEPLTQISQIDKVPGTKDMAGIVNALAPDLEQYSGIVTPDFGMTVPANSAIYPVDLFIPIDVVLGDMYLETNQYAKAAQSYITYLTQVAEERHTAFVSVYSRRNSSFGGMDSELPTDWAFDNNTTAPATLWSSIFTAANGSSDVITYIPMARNSRQGATTVLPLAFGYNFYSSAPDYTEEIQIAPSQAYLDLSNSTPYYYLAQTSGNDKVIKETTNFGDLRYRSIIYEREDAESETSTVWITKYRNANIILYRRTTVLLHLAEAFNRLGMPDAAFAILKDGINTTLINPNNGPGYISEETRLALQTTYPLLSIANMSKFSDDDQNINRQYYYGVHSHGAGWTRDYDGVTYQRDLSPYQYETVVGRKMEQLAEQYAIAVGTTKQDTINAMEDLLCDEYALELAFEGSRFFDLCRLARHKNAENPYGGNFGSEWLARKLAFKNPQKDLTDPKNWYLPFK